MKPARITVVSIGTELTEGRNLDTNSQWLSTELTRLGLDVRCHITLSDRQEDLESFLRQCRDSVIITGGIGPTVDDRTRQAIASAYGVQLVVDEKALKDLHERYRRRDRTPSPHSESQAYIPVGFEALNNPFGTATAIARYFDDGRFLISLPGVPREMRSLFSEFIEGRLRAVYSLSHFNHLFEIHTIGSHESHLNDLVGDLLVDDDEITSSILVDDYEIMMRWRPRSPKHLAKAQSLYAQARTRLGSLVFLEREGDITTLERIPDPLASEVVRQLRERSLRVAFAESCTGGLAAGLLTEVAGSSEVFEMGIVAYQNWVKNRYLGVSEEVLAVHGAVSEACVAAMARGLAEVSGADINISISGIAGPISDQSEKPVGIVCFGVEFSGECVGFTCHFNGTRDQVRQRSARSALNLVRLVLLAEGIPDIESVPYQWQPETSAEGHNAGGWPATTPATSQHPA